MAEEKPRKKRGPKGGVRHTPGRGHRSKSDPQKAKRFQKKAAKRRQAQQDDLRRHWAEWDALSPEQQKLLPELQPSGPRPSDEDEATA